MNADDIPPDLPDAVSFYDRYATLCRRMGVEPVAPERAAKLVETWNAMFEGVGVTGQ
jgi:hypothetical protein